MYGLKEKALARFLIKIMRIDKSSDDGYNLLNWKLPAQGSSSGSSGDFPGRCHEVLLKRPARVEVGDMTIDEVNERLDLLSAAPREEKQLPVLAEFYKRMNADELTWLIRIVLRQMKVGATEKTFFEIFHPDAVSLFNISSSLRRVCWELWNPNIRLESEEAGVSPMQCFQPQLAQFSSKDFNFVKMVSKMRPTEEDPEFWIEEKLDGERMQLHMITDESVAGGKRFKFWSRKAKEYTYLYGNGLCDETSALTQHLRDAFKDGVENVVLDGEMITWDAEQDAPVPFGTLKTAALEQSRNPYAGGNRPLLKVFDILYLNGNCLSRYTLRDRRKALEASINPVHRRLEIHDRQKATSANEIEPALRRMIAEASEGLVIKNPRSSYRLNDRNDDWVKVKPEYMEEFGESLDCLVIGGYYGSGKRGGGLSSFLCGLRADAPASEKSGELPHKHLSFFKVGGGFTANDYANIRHYTEGKWIKWDPRNPPTDYVVLGGGPRQFEKPDVWIKPVDSLVVQVKAASVTDSEEFGCNLTLRFPRFQRLRSDKSWETALSLQEFLELRASTEQQHRENREKAMKAVQRTRTVSTRKKPRVIAGYNAEDVNGIKYEAASGQVFSNMTFFIMTDCTVPEKKSKPELEAIVKANGGRIVQTHTAVKGTISVAERRTVKVASLQKRAQNQIIKPIWIFDCVEQGRKDFARGLLEIILPFEKDRHVYFLPDDEQEQEYAQNTDVYGDSYARDTTVKELKELIASMKTPAVADEDKDVLGDVDYISGWMFKRTVLYFDPVDSAHTNGHTEPTDLEALDLEQKIFIARTTAQFAGAVVTDAFHDTHLTHIVVHPGSDLKRIRKSVSSKAKIPRVVTLAWIEDSWREHTRIDEERFAAP